MEAAGSGLQVVALGTCAEPGSLSRASQVGAPQGGNSGEFSKMPFFVPDGSETVPDENPAVTCPACRGQHRLHTHAVGCRLFAQPNPVQADAGTRARPDSGGQSKRRFQLRGRVCGRSSWTSRRSSSSRSTTSGSRFSTARPRRMPRSFRKERGIGLRADEDGVHAEGPRHAGTAAEPYAGNGGEDRSYSITEHFPRPENDTDSGALRVGRRGSALQASKFHGKYV